MNGTHVIGFICAILAAIFIIFITVSAWAHHAPEGWAYDPECCSGLDCRPLPDGMVEPSTAGWLVKFTGETIPYNDKRVRFSGDNHFHWCAFNALAKEDLTGKTRCLYVPDMGS